MGKPKPKRKYVSRSIRFKLYFEDLPKKAKQKRVGKNEDGIKRVPKHRSRNGLGLSFRAFVRRFILKRKTN